MSGRSSPLRVPTPRKEASRTATPRSPRPWGAEAQGTSPHSGAAALPLRSEAAAEAEAGGGARTPETVHSSEGQAAEACRVS